MGFEKVRKHCSLLATGILFFVNEASIAQQQSEQAETLNALSSAVAMQAISLPSSSLGVSPQELSYNVGVGDLNGDGRYDFVVRVWIEMNEDPIATFETRTYALLDDGTRLWEFNHHLTSNDISGDPTWVVTLTVWDMDGDGKDEVMTQVKQSGQIKLVMLNGQTGAIKRSINLASPKSILHATLAYLDGVNPYLVITHGANILTIAYDRNFNEYWKFDQSAYYKLHSLTNIYAVDFDGDGKDEIIQGPLLLDDNGSLYLDGTSFQSPRKGQAARSFVGDIIPSNPGLEWYLIRTGDSNDPYYVQPNYWEGPYVIDIDQKSVIWHQNLNDSQRGWGRNHRGWLSDMNPGIAGMEMKATGYYWEGNEWQNALNGIYGNPPGPDDTNVGGYDEKYFIYGSGGEVRQRGTGSSTGYPVYWDDDAGPEYYQYGNGKLFDTFGGSLIESGLAVSYGSGEPIQADIRGDWREEIIVPSGYKLYIYQNNSSTDFPNRPSARTDHDYLMNMASLGTGLPKPISHNASTWMDDGPPPPTTLTLQAPNGGESWQVGSSHTITWNSQGAIANVKLEYSVNNGGSWATIIGSTSNDGNYNWTIPAAVSSQSLVRLSDAADSDPQDVSNAAFSIVAPPLPTVTLISPNGGESLVVGNSHNITWSSTGSLGNVKLEYSVDEGGSWTMIASSTSNDGNHNWTIPDVVSSQSLVRISDAADGDPQDVSNAVFSIVAPPPPPIINSFAPSSGAVGTEATIAGNNFVSVIGVKVNLTSASSFITESATQIRFTVPPGATRGKISVTTTAGSALSENDFVVTSDGNETFSFQPSDDAYVRSSAPSSNFGTASALRQRQSGSEKLYSFLKFNVGGLSGTVQKAVLRFYVTDASNDGGAAYVVSNNYLNTTTPWIQGGVNWNNAPLISGVALSSIGAVSVGATVEFDVTAAIAGDGVYSFGLKNNSSDPVFYSSQEGSNKPLLIIQAGTAPSNAPSIASFSPTNGPIGTEVTIAGNNFTGASAVKFNGVTAVEFFVDANTQIRATVPSSATTGKISVTTPNGTAVSTNDFTISSSGGGATLSFLPSDDAYVRLSSPTSNFGSASVLRMRKTSSETMTIYLKFGLIGLEGTVQNAKLRLYVTDAGNEGGAVYSVSNDYQGTATAWVQSGLNWNNAPAISGTALSSAGAVSVGSWVEFDLTAAISGNGIYSFGLKNNSSDVIYYTSKEGPNKPELVIQTSSSSLAARAETSFMQDATILPERFELYQNYPNPFNPETRIEYDLPEATKVRVNIYNLLGQSVRTVIDQENSAGHHIILWDGRDSEGKRVSTGVYFYRLVAGEFVATRKMLFLP